MTQHAAHDALLVAIADYVSDAPQPSQHALDTARLCLLDALGCLAGALDAPDIRPILGPIVPGTSVPLGCRVPGTPFVLDPVRAAFNTSALIRWLDFSDTTIRGGHPSDSIGAVLAIADYVSRREAEGAAPFTVLSVFEAMVRTYEIQGVLADTVKFDAPAVGLDAVLSVKLACAAVVTQMLGGSREHVVNAISNAVLDGGTLNAYRHPPNAGTRKGWAGADAASRGVWFAMLALAGEMGYPQPLSASTWGFHDVVLEGRVIELRRPLGCWAMENVIFKLLPCQRNATTAAEAALSLHPHVHGRIHEIREVTVFTHAEAIERIDKRGPLQNPAARDHCLQFIVAAALVFGDLRPEHYREPLALERRIDFLRDRTRVVEDPEYSRGYLDPHTLSCANAVQVEFSSGFVTPKVEVTHPAGDPARRSEALPNVRRKFLGLAGQRWRSESCSDILYLFSTPARLDDIRVRDFLATLVTGE